MSPEAAALQAACDALAAKIPALIEKAKGSPADKQAMATVTTTLTGLAQTIDAAMA